MMDGNVYNYANVWGGFDALQPTFEVQNYVTHNRGEHHPAMPHHPFPREQNRNILPPPTFQNYQLHEMTAPQSEIIHRPPWMPSKGKYMPPPMKKIQPDMEAMRRKEIATAAQNIPHIMPPTSVPMIGAFCMPDNPERMVTDDFRWYTPSLEQMDEQPQRDHTTIPSTSQVNDNVLAPPAAPPKKKSSTKRKRKKEIDPAAEEKKKRSKNESAWARNKRKELRQKGEAYVSVRGKEVRARKVQPVDCSHCKFECTARITDEQRQKVFKIYWNLKSFKEKIDFIVRFVQEEVPKQKVTGRRSFTRRYMMLVNGNDQRVCKDFFVNTLDISESTVVTCLAKKRKGLSAMRDLRGRHAPKNKTSEEMRRNIREHILAMTGLQGHSDLTKLAENKNFSATKLFDHYKQDCEMMGKKPCSRSMYRKIFALMQGKAPSPSTLPVDSVKPIRLCPKLKPPKPKIRPKKKPKHFTDHAENINNEDMNNENMENVNVNIEIENNIDGEDNTEDNEPNVDEIIPAATSTSAAAADAGSETASTSYVSSPIQNLFQSIIPPPNNMTTSQPTLVADNLCPTDLSQNLVMPQNLSLQVVDNLPQNLHRTMPTSINQGMRPPNFTSAPMTNQVQEGDKALLNLMHGEVITTVHNQLPINQIIPLFQGDNAAAAGLQSFNNQNQPQVQDSFESQSQSLLFQHGFASGVLAAQNQLMNRNVNLNVNMNVSPPKPITQENQQQKKSGSPRKRKSSKPTKDKSGEKKEPKKREKDEGMWQRNVRKALRFKGEAYYSVKGKLVEARGVRSVDCSTCKFQCTSNISDEERFELFDNYWSLDTYQKKIEHLCTLVEEYQPSKPQTGRRAWSRRYTFEVKWHTFRVCKDFFLATLDISESVVTTALEKMRKGPEALADFRGKHTPSNKTTEEMVCNIRELIIFLTGMRPNHHNNDQLGNEFRDINRLFEIYKVECEKNGRKPASMGVFKRVLKKDFKLTMAPVKKEHKTIAIAPELKTITIAPEPPRIPQPILAPPPSQIQIRPISSCAFPS